MAVSNDYIDSLLKTFLPDEPDTKAGSQDFALPDGVLKSMIDRVAGQRDALVKRMQAGSTGKLMLTDFIAKHYREQYRSPAVTKLEDAELFLLGDSHFAEDERELNAYFIDQFSNSGSLVLVESQSSMKVVDATQHHTTFLLQESRKVMGWDLGTLLDVVGVPAEQAAKWTKLEAENIRLKQEWQKVAKCRDLTAARKLIEAQTDLNQSPDMQEFVKFCSSKEVVDLANRLFPQCIQSMLKTLRAVETMARSTGPRRDFLIAGDKYLVDKTVQEFIGTRKVVILFPKVRTFLGMSMEALASTKEATEADEPQPDPTLIATVETVLERFQHFLNNQQQPKGKSEEEPEVTSTKTQDEAESENDTGFRVPDFILDSMIERVATQHNLFLKRIGAEATGKVTLPDFVAKHYHEHYRSPAVAKLEDAELFLLADTHIANDEQELNAHFIDRFSNSDSLVLVESEPSMKVVDASHNPTTGLLQESRKVMGWDLATFIEITGVPTDRAARWTKVSAEGLRIKLEWQKVAKSRDREAARKLVLANMRLVQDPDIVEMTKFISDPIMLTVIDATFPQRVQSMIKTLTALEGIAPSAQPRRDFLIAGDKHLVDYSARENNPKISLDAFYKFIGTRKVVILVPKTRTFMGEEVV